MKYIEDEIPFEVPDGWAWCRLGVIGNWQSGATPSRRHPEYFGGSIPWLKTGDLNDGFIDNVPEHITEEGFNNSSVVLIPVGSVLIAMYGATIGKLGINNIEVTTNQACCACLPLLVQNRYLFYYLMAMKDTFISQASGGAQPNISKEKIVSTLFAVPPEEEQVRIIQTIDELIDNVQEISDNKELLLNITSSAKSKILDLAIRGKLVPQDSNDEPASVLLDRIRNEKEALIKQGKLKRDKKESIIYKGDDNSYYMTGKKEPLENAFDLPNGWIWASLPEVVFFQEGPGIMKKDFRDSGVPLIRISGLQTDIVSLEGCNYLDPEMVESKWKHFKLEMGDIVICTSASIGKVSIVDSETVGAIPYTGQIRFQMSPAITKDYFLYFAMSDIYLNQVNMLKTGNCIQHYGPTHLKQVIVPLPPIDEQIRISNAIKQYLMHLELISEQIC